MKNNSDFFLKNQISTLYKCRDVKSDVNGGLGMIVKSKHKVDINHLVCSGCLTQPRIITLDEIHSSGSIQVVRRLAV